MHSASRVPLGFGFTLLASAATGLGAGCDRATAAKAGPTTLGATTTVGAADDCCTVPTTTAATAPAATQAAAASRPAATQPAASAVGWRDLFDGKTLAGWRASDFAGHGEPAVEEGLLVLPNGELLTGVTYAGRDVLPRTNYEVQVIAKRTDGTDFFCGLTFPVGDSYASFIAGGWGGSVVGISNIDDKDAAHNDATTYAKFERNRFYAVTVRVEPERLRAWIDDEQVVDVDTKGKKINLRQDIDEGKPLGIASFQTTSAVKTVRIRDVPVTIK
ncbi:MAG: hypothetical protein JWO31_3387 [Phycisphaerales bacterium]|nr:hypothetical protein [Phycisphaerales bacterium]